MAFTDVVAAPGFLIRMRTRSWDLFISKIRGKKVADRWSEVRRIKKFLEECGQWEEDYSSHAMNG